MFFAGDHPDQAEVFARRLFQVLLVDVRGLRDRPGNQPQFALEEELFFIGGDPGDALCFGEGGLLQFFAEDDLFMDTRRGPARGAAGAHVRGVDVEHVRWASVDPFNREVAHPITGQRSLHQTRFALHILAVLFHFGDLFVGTTIRQRRQTIEARLFFAHLFVGAGAGGVGGGDGEGRRRGAGERAQTRQQDGAGSELCGAHS